MKNFLLIFLFLSGIVYAEDTPLFATVINVAKNDNLNVRLLPNYRSKKVGILPNGAEIGVDKCKIVGHSKWCKIHLLVQMDYGNRNNFGWVNAKYLKFSNRGYVNIIGKKNDCYYAASCSNGICKVVIKTKWIQNKLSKVITKDIIRQKLMPESHFGAASNDMDGYCAIGNYIK